MNWEHKETARLKEYIQKLLKEIQKDWRKKRKEKSDKTDKPSKDFNKKKWLETLPKDTAEVIRKLLKHEAENSAYTKEDVLKTLTDIAPKHAEFHWRHFDEIFQNKEIEINEETETIKSLYEQGYYYQALFEAIKLYIEEIRSIIPESKATTDYGLMGEVFKEKKDEGLIQLTKKNDMVEQDIEKGHADFSRGVVSGFRNPLAHASESKLRNKKLITPGDCLNILSLLSHLLRRLKDRVSPRD